SPARNARRRGRPDLGSYCRFRTTRTPVGAENRVLWCRPRQWVKESAGDENRLSETVELSWERNARLRGTARQKAAAGPWASPTAAMPKLLDRSQGLLGQLLVLLRELLDGFGLGRLAVLLDFDRLGLRGAALLLRPGYGQLDAVFLIKDGERLIHLLHADRLT